MSNLRIAYVINDVAFFVSHRLPLAISVLEKGGEVCVMTGLNVNTKIENEAIQILKKNKIKNYRCKFSQALSNPFNELIGLFQLIIFLRKFRPSTVHSATAKGNFMASIACVFIPSVRLILSVSGLGTMFTGPRTLKKTLILFIYKLFLRVSLRKTEHKVIFQNKTDSENFIKIIPIEKSSISIVPGSGVETSKYLPSNKRINKRNVLLPSRVLYEKGVKEFIDASRILKAKNFKANFFIAGDYKSLNPSAVPKEKIGIWEDDKLVKYLGHQTDMSQLYKRMAIICLPSWREGFPKAIMEASSCGLPVITTNVPGCRDAIIKNKTGLLVPIKDPISLAKSIEKLIIDPKLAKYLGSNGRKLAVEKFDLSNIIPKILKLYK